MKVQPTQFSLPALGGDLSSVKGSTTLTLNTVLSSPGVFGSGTAIPVLTVNAKGLVTSISSTAITLGTASTKNTGTSGNTVPLLDGFNTWSGQQTFASSISVNGNLTVNGTTTTINATNLEVADAIIGLASNNSTGNVSHIGLRAERGSAGNDAYLVFDESLDIFSFQLADDDAQTNATQLPLRAGRFISTAGTGVAPLTVASTTLVNNLNSQLLNGQLGSFYTNASNINAGTLNASYLPARTGDVTSPAGSSGYTLATVNSNVGTFGSGTAIPVITVNAKGLVTSVSTTAITLGTASTKNTGTSGNTVPLLDGINTWSGQQTHTAPVVINATSASASGLNITPGTDPTNPNNGDIWTSSAGMFVRLAATTNQLAYLTSNITGNASTASKWATARTLSWTGDATASLSLDGSANVTASLTLTTVNSNVGTFGSGTTIPVITVDAKGRVTAASTAAFSLANAFYQRFVVAATPSSTYTLSSAISTPQEVIVSLNGLRLDPTNDYTISGTTLTIDASVAQVSGQVLLVERAAGSQGIQGPQGTPGSGGDMYRSDNLSGMANYATSRSNLGVTATGQDTTYAYRANNLSDLANPATARSNLGVTATGGDTTYLYRANNLSDLANITTARSNLGAQAYHINLQAMAGLTTAADQVIYWTGSGTASMTSLTSFSRIALSSPTALAFRSAIGAEASGLRDATTTSAGNALYTLQIADMGKVVEITTSSANTVYIVGTNVLPWPVGATLEVVQNGTGQVTFAGDPQVTIRSDSGYVKLKGQWSGATLRHRGNNEWTIFGALVA